ncbi:DinB family protein [Mycolicibacter senuensis]|uniref:DinB family protein n=2 Tax=Mycolicibacter kumamotonensis TaxID=354243 RepID=A0A7K3LGA0_9MYCO|nr:DinB family protein [Mycolicibacter senuensis]NDJ91368.1 DinB family protein [Mycolicibacter kumamotonensis]RAU95583.1 DinB family protein [Mycolicibacter senuensis]
MEEICSECDFDESTASPAKVAAVMPQLAKAIAAGIRSIPDDVVRHRPAPETWSPLEYLGHLRESMAFHRWLIEKALAEDNPLIPMVDPDESVAQAGYRSADTDELIGQFGRRVQRLCELLTTLDDTANHRILTLDGRQITAALVARSAWHECHHHHGDIRRLGEL